MRTAALVLALGLAWAGPAIGGGRGFELAADGRARVALRIPDEPTAVERAAAGELSAYLERVTGAPFPIRGESELAPDAPAIEVGLTAAVRAAAATSGLGPEEWVIRADGERLLLYGGARRGTLYAVYHFLEDRVGVRWWSPWDEHVPRRPRLTVPRAELRGTPAFAYRELTDVGGPPEFRARRRMNGHFTRLPERLGGVEAYGPPHHVHTFELHFPPDELFAEHPEYFSEIGGLRYGGPAQLCLTNAALLDAMVERVAAAIESERAAARRQQRTPARMFSVSQNDWARPCGCPSCGALARREGAESGPLLAFVDAVAERIAPRYPDVLIETLAYQYSLAPPRTVVARDNVSMRLSALHQRDFSRSIVDPANREYRDALLGWSARIGHLRIWDYVVVWADEGELPLPNLPVLARDLRFYRRHGIEGIYAQQDFLIDADMRDLKLWVLSRLLEDPGLDQRRLVREFSDGFYGPAAPQIRRYLRVLERAARRRPSRLRFRAASAHYAWLDRRFLARAQRIFDAAERRVTDDPRRLQRVRHARLTLDRATLLAGPTADAADRPGRRAAVIERLRQTWLEEIERRLPPGAWPAARAALREEIETWVSNQGDGHE